MLRGWHSAVDKQLPRQPELGEGFLQAEREARKAVSHCLESAAGSSTEWIQCHGDEWVSMCIGREEGGVGSAIVNPVHIVMINLINIQVLQTLYSSPAKHYVQRTSMHIHNYNYMPYPYDSVKFCGSDLLGPLHSSCHLLLMLL